MKDLTSLFLSQSYDDCYSDYMRALNNPSFPHFDYIVLTASNDFQAKGFKAQIQRRKESGLLPVNTEFAVIPDRDGKRIGSAGATLSVIKYIANEENSSDFSGLRILVIHSGGDSKRVPQYSALGKLFSPVPHKLKNGENSTLFDEFMIAASSIPSRIKEGMVLLSGDVLLLFNPIQIDYNNVGAVAVSFKEDVETGKKHGVFLGDTNGNVKRFLHKQTVETLHEMGAVNQQNCVDIDTGAVIFGTDMLKSLYSLIDTDKKYNEMVNDKIRLSLYGDFLYPLAGDSTLEAFYEEKPESEFCDELMVARTKVWAALRPYKLKLLRLAPAKFVHFGTTGEILCLMTGGVDAYSNLGWARQIGSSISGDVSGYNSIVSEGAKIGNGCYSEVSYVHSKANIGNNVLLSFVDIHDETIPSDVVVHGLKQRNGKFVARIYGIADNPKEDKLFGKPLNEIIINLGIMPDEIWKNDNHTLWMADIYPECDNIKQAVCSAINLYNIVNGSGDINAWREAPRKSLCSGFNDADPDAVIAWDKRMQELVCMDGIVKLIREKKPATLAKDILKTEKLTNIQKKWLENRLKKSEFSEQIRLLYYIGMALGGKNGDSYISECFKLISDTILRSTLKNLKYNDSVRIVTDRHAVNLPLRVNWGGGWSDTPPYCNENGGKVLNCAIKLNGELPVEVTLIKISDKKIIFDSRDMDVHGEFEDIEPLQRTGDPYDPFALQKTCLLACGIIPKTQGNLKEILTRLGGGFEMHSEVANVPKGSGLGTSSILSAACVKAVFEFMGIEYTEDTLYSTVLAMEQIMSTGGGWQDQVGGVTNGIKYIASDPGIDQTIRVEHINIPDSVKEELNERFCLICTGQRRLARNLLREVVGKYIGNDKENVYALKEIQNVADLMRESLENGDIDAFAKLLNRHWELSKMIDIGSTNTLIDQIFASIEDLIDGKFVCGAGGGGFLQVIMKKNVSKKQIHERLKDVFQDFGVDVWDCEII